MTVHDLGCDRQYFFTYLLTYLLTVHSLPVIDQSQTKQPQTADTGPGVATWEVTLSAQKQAQSPASVGLQLVLLRTVYSQSQGCVWAAHQLGGDVEQPWLMSKYDVIRKTGSTQHITTPPEKDRATAMGNRRTEFGEDRTCCSEYVIADRQTQTDTLITILRSLSGE